MKKKIRVLYSRRSTDIDPNDINGHPFPLHKISLKPGDLYSTIRMAGSIGYPHFTVAPHISPQCSRPEGPVFRLAARGSPVPWKTTCRSGTSYLEHPKASCLKWVNLSNLGQVRWGFGHGGAVYQKERLCLPNITRRGLIRTNCQHDLPIRSHVLSFQPTGTASAQRQFSVPHVSRWG
jgi:hypothetical protein